MKLPENFLNAVYDVLRQAQKNAKTAVNLAMVYAYYDIGKKIVEEEQNGENRAKYGAYLIQELSAFLTDQFGKGFSVANLKLIRQFYQTYCHDEISETVFSQFANLPTTDNGNTSASVERVSGR